MIPGRIVGTRAHPPPSILSARSLRHPDEGVGPEWAVFDRSLCTTVPAGSLSAIALWRAGTAMDAVIRKSME